MNNTGKSIWIDLDNSPHVPLFAPIIKHYRDSRVEVILTARDHSQTLQLLDLAGFGGQFAVVGRHYGKSKLNKIRGLLSRTFQLISHIKRSNKVVAVAVSHGSRSMVLAARWLKIPVVTMYDYEFTETGIFNRFSDKVIVPEAITDSVLDEIGLAENKRLKYPGIKEELYVRNFRPSKGFLEVSGISVSPEKVIVVLRPPATTATYHSEQSDVLLAAILRRVLTSDDVFTIIVPRTRDQAAETRTVINDIAPADQNHLILENAVAGLDLAYVSDLVISGGGTMNREAALLGVPVYSIFAGRQGALDAQMEKEGAITFIRTEVDVAKIELKKRERDAVYVNRLTDRVERFVIEQIDRYL